MFGENVFRSRMYKCILGVLVGANANALAVDVQQIATAAEVATACGRSMVAVANGLEAAGSNKAYYVRLIADSARACNELLAMLNHPNDSWTSYGYNGLWLAYDVAQITRHSQAQPVVQPAVDADDVLVRTALLFQRTLLPAIETVVSVAAAGSDYLTNNPEKQAKLRVLLYSATSLTRSFELCLEHRDQPEMRRYLAIALANGLLTAYEIYRLMNVAPSLPGDEQEKKAAEEKARLDAEKKAAEEKASLDAEKKAAEEKASLDAENKAAEDERIHQGQLKKAQEDKEAKEKQEQEEHDRQVHEQQEKEAQDKKAAEEQVRLDADKKAAEDERIHQEQLKKEQEEKAAKEKLDKEEHDRQVQEQQAKEAQDKKAAEEQVRLDAEKKAAEDERIRQEQLKKEREDKEAKEKLDKEERDRQEQLKKEQDEKAAREKQEQEARAQQEEERRLQTIDYTKLRLVDPRLIRQPLSGGDQILQQLANQEWERARLQHEQVERDRQAQLKKEQEKLEQARQAEQKRAEEQERLAKEKEAQLAELEKEMKSAYDGVVGIATAPVEAAQSKIRSCEADSRYQTFLASITESEDVKRVCLANAKRDDEEAAKYRKKLAEAEKEEREVVKRHSDSIDMRIDFANKAIQYFNDRATSAINDQQKQSFLASAARHEALVKQWKEVLEARQKALKEKEDKEYEEELARLAKENEEKERVRQEQLKKEQAAKEAKEKQEQEERARQEEEAKKKAEEQARLDAEKKKTEEQERDRQAQLKKEQDEKVANEKQGQEEEEKKKDAQRGIMTDSGFVDPWGMSTEERRTARKNNVANLTDPSKPSILPSQIPNLLRDANTSMLTPRRPQSATPTTTTTTPQTVTPDHRRNGSDPQGNKETKKKN